MTGFVFVTAVVVFLTSCMGFGYFAELLARRRKWRGWVSILLIFALAFIWPIFLIVYVIQDASRYLKLHPHDDAPGMVVVSVVEVLAPLVFFMSFPPIVVGAMIARRKVLRARSRIAENETKS
jgi:hypothetical protein